MIFPFPFENANVYTTNITVAYWHSLPPNNGSLGAYVVMNTYQHRKQTAS
jgi:hypothetical protein